MEGDSLIEDLIAFAQVEASQFLADMFAVWLFEYRPNGPADALRYLFEKGDRGHFLDGAYNRRTGRALFTDIRELLERWIADLRHNPARQLMRPDSYVVGDPAAAARKPFQVSQPKTISDRAQSAAADPNAAPSARQWQPASSPTGTRSPKCGL